VRGGRADFRGLLCLVVGVAFAAFVFMGVGGGWFDEGWALNGRLARSVVSHRPRAASPDLPEIACDAAALRAAIRAVSR